MNDQKKKKINEENLENSCQETQHDNNNKELNSNPIRNKSDKKRIFELESELIEIQESLRDIQLRAQAENENLRRRSELNVEKAHKFALEKFAHDLLPVIDSLERALEISDKNNVQLKSMIEGIELTLKAFIKTINKFGISIINEENVPFNPEIHQAISVIKSESKLSNQIIKVIQKGYKLNGRLLRPAVVSVSE
ncbi:nucleotide exchange factor GrpE [Candidatus Tachikawaea gelatinosa]|nr:nucleotide exchange factor GrpE [Candidatus Tachikawaea gelatinosa]